MNQPTEDRFKRLEEGQERLKEDVRILKQQQTEPIKLTIERRQYEVESTLEKHTELLREQDDLLTKIYTDVGHTKADIGVLKQTAERLEQKMSDGFQAMEQRLDAIAEVQKLILNRLPQPEGE